MRQREVQVQLRSAQAELDATRGALDAAASPWRARLRRHRIAVIVGGGLVGGILAGFLPKRLWTAAGSLLAIASSAIARSMIAPMIVTSMLTPRAVGDAGRGDDGPGEQPRVTH